MTNTQFAALSKWIRAEARCAAAYGKASPDVFQRLVQKRKAAMQAFWELNP